MLCILSAKVMCKRCSPVIIDNTNMQAWEMKPYVKLALARGYSITFNEPHTSCKFDPIELEKRNKHSVSRKKIGQMLERFEMPMSLDIVMNSQEPFTPTRHPSQQQRHKRTTSPYVLGVYSLVHTVAKRSAL
ncbi:NEDD4-binding protein 2-like 2 [Salmo salar]|uniref:NEDD4-binding protein 2-like 2 n=1 Tax=Salmo salar TaxID=8030 RepID=A0ABM3C8R6_SALSA|nr:NEDD4-binding protein 2-like 2 [Salmo salar]